MSRDRAGGEDPRCAHSLHFPPSASAWTPRSTRSRPARRRQQQIRDRDGLTLPPARADGDDSAVIAEVNAGDGDVGAEHLRLEWKLEVLLDRREPAGGPRLLSVRVDRGLLDHGRQRGFAVGRWTQRRRYQPRCVAHAAFSTSQLGVMQRSLANKVNLTRSLTCTRLSSTPH